MRSRSYDTRSLYVVVAAADTVLAGSGSRPARLARRLTKPALMPLLAASLATRPASGRSGGVRSATLVAEALSWGGDVALLGKGRRPFLAGLTSFFGAHVAYTVGFRGLSGRPSPRPVGAAPKVVLGVTAVAGPGMAYAAGRKDPALRLPVALYAIALAATVAAATDLDPALASTARSKIALGAALFLLSDLTLGLTTFVLDERPALQSVVMATYTSGQLLIADGVAGLG